MTKQDIQNAILEYIDDLRKSGAASWRVRKIEEILFGFYNDYIDVRKD